MFIRSAAFPPLAMKTVVCYCLALSTSASAQLLGASQPIWPNDAANPSAFAIVRKTFELVGADHAQVSTATLLVTAESSPLCAPPCKPHGGTSAPKLLGAYKAFLNANGTTLPIGMGPGRNVNGTQVDLL